MFYSFKLPTITYSATDNAPNPGAGTYVDFTSIYDDWINNTDYIAVLYIEIGTTGTPSILWRGDQDVVRFNTVTDTSYRIKNIALENHATFFRSSTDEDTAKNSATAKAGELFWFRCEVNSDGTINNPEAAHNLTPHGSAGGYLKPWRGNGTNATPISLKYDNVDDPGPQLYIQDKWVGAKVVTGTVIQGKVTDDQSAAQRVYVKSIMFIKSTDATNLWPDKNDWL